MILIMIIIIHGNMIFSVYLVKMVFIFPANMIIHFCQKSKDRSLTENALNDYISGVIQKDDIQFPLIKQTFTQSKTHKEN